MANLLPVGSGNLSSADFSVGAGVPTTIHMLVSASGGIPQPPGPQVAIEIKGSNATYVPLYWLTGANPAVVVAGVGTYRVTRSNVSVGVDQD